MPGRKDKKGDHGKRPQGKGSSGAGNLASMFGLDTGMDFDEADLEAELLALEGKSPAGKGGGKSPKGGRDMLSMKDLDQMVANVDKIGDDEDLSDVDDDDTDLLGELQSLTEDQSMELEATPPPPSHKKGPAPSPRKSSGGSSSSVSTTKSPPSKGGGAVGEVSERLDLYKRALQQAESAGESAKVRRYKRSIGTLEQLLKNAKAGKAVNLDDMPPPVFVKEAATTKDEPPTQVKPRPPPPVKPAPQTKQPSNLIDLDDPEFDEFNLMDEELASMAASMVDDRQDQAQTQSGSYSSMTVPQSSSIIAASHSGSSVAASHSGSSIAASHSGSSLKTAPPKPTPSPRTPPQPKPHPKPNPPPPSLGPGGLIDLDDPAFDEFTLSEEDLAAMATFMVDDRQTKKPKIENESPSTTSVQSSQASKTPPQATRRAPPPPTRQAPEPATQSLPATLKKPMSAGSDKSAFVSFLSERMDQYQQAAKAQKDPNKNKEYRLIAAKFNRVVKGVESGQDIDLTQMPGPPPGYKSSFDIDLKKFSPPAPKPVTPPTKGQSSSATDVQTATDESDSPNPEIPVPKTPLEALQQRLAKYKEGLKTAQDKGESSRVRRMGRIIKQYESAIKDTKAGKPCDYEDLPAPPGYPPIPAGRRVAPPSTVPLPTQSLPVRSPASSASQHSASQQSSTPSVSQQQMTLVQKRLAELKRAAKLEHSNNNREGALELMKRAKGAETMLKAAQSGLPVNMEQLPPSPFADIDDTKPSTQVVSHLRPAEEKDKDTFDLIIKQLERQVEICDRNADTYKKMGSNASAIEYENMSQNSQRELLALKGIQGAGFGPPKFSLEMRTLTIIHSNTHISSSVCEVEVTKVVNLTRPPKYEEKDMDVYVEAEFPYPTDSPPKKSTEVVHKTCSPEFKDQNLQFDIDRKHHRSMVRAFKRTPLKCTVWQHRSLRKHIFIGQVNVPLEALETKSEVHSSLDLLDERGRKPVGGKLEVFVRLREPLTGRDQEECEEQWLVFKESIAAKSAVPMPKLAPKGSAKKGGAGGGAATTPNYSLLSPVKPESTTSVAALKFEFSLVTSALKAGYKDAQTVQRGKLVKTRTDAIQQHLQSDARFRQGYPKQVAKEIQQEKLLEAQLAKQGKKAEVVILQKRRLAMEKEIKDMLGK